MEIIMMENKSNGRVFEPPTVLQNQKFLMKNKDVTYPKREICSIVDLRGLTK
jgi:hypothetical protein